MNSISSSCASLQHIKKSLKIAFSIIYVCLVCFFALCLLGFLLLGDFFNYLFLVISFHIKNILCILFSNLVLWLSVCCIYNVWFLACILSNRNCNMQTNSLRWSLVSVWFCTHIGVRVQKQAWYFSYFQNKSLGIVIGMGLEPGKCMKKKRVTWRLKEVGKWKGSNNGRWQNRAYTLPCCE